MLPLTLVLLIASSALAAPTVEVTQYSINEVEPLKSNGRLISRALPDRLFEIVDGGDQNVYIGTITEYLKDLASLNDRETQALAVGQSLAVLSQLATSSPGDACAAAHAVDAYARNPGSSRGAVYNFIQDLIANIDSIVQLANNPNAARYSVGSRGNCNGGGKVYSFESAWDAILSNASPSSAGLVNEEYCAAKRLYTAFNTRSNNVGAYLTAASLPPVNQIFQETLETVARFLAAVANGNPDSAAGAAKEALHRAANNL